MSNCGSAQIAWLSNPFVSRKFNMSTNNPGPQRGHVSAEHLNDRIIHKVPESVDKAAAPSKRRIHTEPDLVFPEIVESAARQSAS